LEKLLTVEKIISGGQTGADRGALDFALLADISHTGYVPKGRRAEDGRVPDRYEMIEMATSDYRPRTAANIKAADMTVIFMDGKVTSSRGTAMTLGVARKFKKPHVVLHIDKGIHENAKELRTALLMYKPKSINVAGHRESHSPGLQSYVKLVLFEVMVNPELNPSPRLDLEDQGPRVRDSD